MHSSEEINAPLIVPVDGGRSVDESVPAVQDQFTVDEALLHLGHGLMQYCLLFILGIADVTVSMNIVLMSFLEPNVKCEWGLNSGQETMISVAVLLGMSFGSNLWGAVADRHGRKLGIGLALLVQGSAGVIASVAPNYLVLLAARCMVGVGLGGMGTTSSAFSEFLPTNVRGYNLCWFQLFWTVGGAVEAALGWIILPHLGWRVLTLVTALPALATVPLICLMPESPRYLVVMGQNDNAMSVLHKIERFNGSSLPEGTLRSHSAPSAEPKILDQLMRSQECDSCLFERPLHRVTPIVWYMAFSAGVGYYGIVILTASVRTNEKEDECIGDEAHFNNKDYFSILIDACAEVPGCIVAMLTVETLGRVRSMLFSWCGSWISMILLLFFPSGKTIFLFGARFFISYTDIFMFVITSELYPSSSRCFATGMMCSVSQIGGVLSPFITRALLDMAGLKVVSGLCASLFLAANVSACFLLPFETAGKSMKDDMSDVRDDSLCSRLNEGDSHA